MAARDRWSWSVKCDDCGTSGTVKVSEDDHPYMKDPDFQVDSVSVGFAVAKRGRSAVDTKIMCTGCGKVVG